MLAGTKRVTVPVRRAFIQRPKSAGEERGSVLARLARDGSALDAYLLIHAMASSSAPYLASYPAATWVQLARLDEAASFDAAKSRWSKLVSKLERLQLIERHRRGNQMDYELLHESGDGSKYVRPKSAAEGHWLHLPYSYWTEEHDAHLTTAEKLMLLISLDQVEGFALPMNRAPKWYGVSEPTARRGFRGLENKGFLTKTVGYVVSARSPTGWMEEFRYTLTGPYAVDAIKAAQKNARKPKVAMTEGGAK